MLLVQDEEILRRVVFHICTDVQSHSFGCMPVARISSHSSSEPGPLSWKDVAVRLSLVWALVPKVSHNVQKFSWKEHICPLIDYFLSPSPPATVVVVVAVVGGRRQRRRRRQCFDRACCLRETTMVFKRSSPSARSLGRPVSRDISEKGLP